MFELLRSLVRHRRLLKDFVVRDLKARYVGSTMGFFWSVVFPIINLFVYMFVFRLVLNARWSDSQGALEVAIVMLAGIVVWSAFAETISRSTNTLVDNANLIQKVVFPAEVLPTYLTISSLINMCIGLPVVMGAVLWFGHLSPPAAYIRVPHDWVTVGVDASGDPLLERHPSPDVIGEWGRPAEIGERPHHEYAVRIELTRAWRKDLRIPFQLSGTAERGVDYLMPDDEIVIPSGQLSGTLVFVPLDDATQEDLESVVVELDPGGGVPIMSTETVKLPSGEVIQRGTKVDEGAPRLEFLIANSDTVAPEDARPLGTPGAIAPKKEVMPADIKAEHYPLSMGRAYLAIPLLFLLQVVFTAGLSYFLAAFNLFLRDTFHLVGVAITVWMFSTPIFYPGSMVELRGFGWILAINPMHWLIDCYRSVILYGIWPEGRYLLMLAGAGLLTLFLGGRFFMKQRSKFPDLL